MLQIQNIPSCFPADLSLRVQFNGLLQMNQGFITHALLAVAVTDDAMESGIMRSDLDPVLEYIHRLEIRFLLDVEPEQSLQS